MRLSSVLVLRRWLGWQERRAQRGASFAYHLDATTVHDDGAGNSIDSGPGRNWVFANTDGIGNNGVKDHVSGSGYVLTHITL
jgi:hypothetical protein